MAQQIPVTFRRVGALMAGASLWLTTLGAPVTAKSSISFNRDVRPILSDNCFACHGIDAKKRKANLRLDLADGAFKADKDGVIAVKPGDLAGSELWKRITTTNEDDVMPPPESHKTLAEEQKTTLRRWIEQGAPYQKHWAFEPITLPPVPKIEMTTGDGTGGGAVPVVRNPIDDFVLARLGQEGLAPSPEADRATLIRRLSFDLRGLPPRPSEVDAFLTDLRPGAYGRLVERFLDTPQYGEQMARPWLDVARYADTHGLHLDNERQMWAYRDWVVKAFNDNLPFDKFTVLQLAGDLLPNATQDQVVATGFNRCNITTGEGGAIDAEFVFRYAVDRTATTVETWLGLTAGCAVCHDHKFDPISAKEFYSLYAFFLNAADPPMDGNALRTPPVLQLKTAEDERRLADFEARVKTAEAKVTDALKTVSYTDPATLTPPPAPRDVENVWADDELPEGWKINASPGAPTQFVTAENGRVYSGQRALKRQDKGLAQDVLEAGDAAPLEVPPNAKLFAYVFLDPADLPRTIMLQFNSGDWEHRAVWGDLEAINWGEKDKPSRARLGDLPKAGEWVRLEFDADKVGLKAGDKLKGLAFTQFGGTVYWDKLGVRGRVDPANDPQQSFLAWSKQYDGKEAKELPGAIAKIFKDSAPTNRTPDQVQQLRDHYLSKVCADTKPVFDPINTEVAGARKQRDEFNEAIPTTSVWHDLEKPREAFIMVRGQYDKPGEKVSPGVPAIFPPLRTDTNLPTRLDLARWLVRDDNPLTARVTVNRFWQQFFGVGLVKTAGDFGSQGEPPSHPELLDWLAATFRDSGWDVKNLVKLMVTSATYRQSSQVTPELLHRDPENRLLARGPRFRLDAEQVRDNALFVSGLLDITPGGKGVKPYQPPNIWEPVGFVGSNTREYKQDTGSALYRRSLYTFFKRTAPAPSMTTFDAPNREQFCTRRERSNTPLQALQLLNDVQHFEAARALAERMLTEGGATSADRLAFAYRTVLARLPSTEELTLVTQALEKHLARYQADPAAAKLAVSVGESKPSANLPEPELAAYTLAANLLLNLDETVTRN